MTELKIHSTTPPENPTYGVKLSESTIQAIVEACFTGISMHFKVKRLPPGQSYNNRIYFIKDSADIEYVLKVNGRFFGPEKIENEAACLLLLDHFCPDIPAPRLVAWSGNGTQVSRRANKSGHLEQFSKESLDIPSGTPGWICMTRVRGQALDMSSVPEDQISSLTVQLSEVVLSWRRNIPKSAFAGNCNFKPYPQASCVDHLYHAGRDSGLTDMYIHGQLGVGKAVAPPMNTLLSFWEEKFKCLMQDLNDEAAFAPNRATVLPLMQDFINNTLPYLQLFKSPLASSPFTFSHSDIAPRNILVSYDPIRITGVVDFEFSGFLPGTEDFFQEYIKDDVGADDWPRDMYNEFLQKLENAGEITPLSIQGTREWDEMYQLGNLETTIAPWWLREGDMEGLARARRGTEQAVKTLRDLQES